MNNLRFIIKKTVLLFVASIVGMVTTTAQERNQEDTIAQVKKEVIQEDVAPTRVENASSSKDTPQSSSSRKPVPYVEIADETVIAPSHADSLSTAQRIKIDGVAAVVGKYVVLDSDVDKAYLELKSQGVSTVDVSRCELAGSLLESKLYAHHAIQDSIVVTDAEIEDYVDKQVDYMTQQIGTEEKVLAFYKKETITAFKEELFEINKANRLSQEMQSKVVGEVEITPDEVRSFFNEIPEEERPLFGTELEIAQIVIEPKIPEEERQAVMDKLRQYREDVLENGASFATKAVLYSQDPGSRSNGGKYTITRQDPFAKEFKDAAFRLQEGEVSEPFETDFGFHILTVDKIRGQQVDVRHVLLIPDVTQATVQEAKARIDSIRTVLASGKVKFSDLARAVSDDKETRENGGQLLNPTTGDTRFEMTKIDPLLYEQVSKLDSGAISKVIPDQDRTGRKKFKIITVTNRYEEHVADYAKDYIKIQELALKEKQLNAVQKWQKEKIADTYIKINGMYRDCEYASNWLKKEE